MYTKMALGISAWMALSGVALGAETGFQDVPEGHWAHDAVLDVSTHRGLLLGGTDGMFHGEQGLTRGQFASSLSRLVVDLEASSKTSWKNPTAKDFALTDVEGTQRTAVRSLVNEYGLWDGVPNMDSDHFYPDQPVTRMEAAQVVKNLMAQGEFHHAVRTQEPEDKRSYTDVKSNVWAYDAILENGTRYRVMIGYPDATFHPARPITRFEYAAVGSSTFPVIQDASLYSPVSTAKSSPDLETRTRAAAIPADDYVVLSADRFQELRALHLGAGGDFLTPMSHFDARVVGYPGSMFWMADAHTGLVPGNPTSLTVGLAPQIPTLSLGANAHVQVQPYLGARGSLVNYIGKGVTPEIGPLVGVIGEVKFGSVGLFALADSSIPSAAFGNYPLLNTNNNLDIGANIAINRGVALTLGGGISNLPAYPNANLNAGIDLGF